MAEKDDENLIGYDPLAWLHESSEQNKDDSPLPEALFAKDDALNDAEAIAEFEAVATVVNEIIEEEPAASEMLTSAYSERTQQIVLDSVQTIQNVAELHERLLQALDSSNKIDIDASAITMIDTATLQLLLVLKQTAINMQKEVAVDFPSERFIEAAELLGLAEMLNVDQAAAGFF